MRPYLAIIKDSFRAAMASRVLYVLLLLITILLIAIAPFHVRKTLDWELDRRTNVNQEQRLLSLIVERHDDGSSAPIARIWELLPETTRQEMQDIAKELGEQEKATPRNRRGRSREHRRTYDALIDDLNVIIEDPGFYQAADWEGVSLPREARELVDQGVDSLSVVLSKRLNRLLLASAVKPYIKSGKSATVLFYYALWELPIPAGITHAQFAQTLTSVLPVYFDKFVMSIGLLIAIVITANMIPETFEPGSLNLLLSKPVSRWGLFASKFAGGCIFIALCAGYLFLGLWLWLGLAMDIWDRAILFSIPLYVLVFAIYFSVSAFVGLIWRSAIVSVILTLIFWAMCFSVGSGYGFVNTKMQNNAFIGLLPVEQAVYPSDLIHQLSAWDDSDRAWDAKTEAEFADEEGKMVIAVGTFFTPLREDGDVPGLRQFLAPVFDQENGRILASQFVFGSNSGRKRLLISNKDDLNFKVAGRFPTDAVEQFSGVNGILAVASDGSFYRLDESKLEAAQLAVDEEGVDIEPTEVQGPEVKEGDDSQVESPSIVSVAKGDPAEESVFTRIGPDKPTWFGSASQVDYNLSRDEFVIYQRGKLVTYQIQGGEYREHRTLEIELGFDESMSCLLAAQGDTICLAFGNGKVITVDAEMLQEKNDYHPESRSGVRQVIGAVDGGLFGVLYRNGNLWILDTADDRKMQKADVIGQGDICTFAFGEAGQLWVGDNTDRVTQYASVRGDSQQRFSAAGGWLERIYRYGLRPFYRACPKPGEFYKVVTHLSSSGDTQKNEDVDMNLTIQSSDPWSPLWSGLAFMLAMLSLGCIVFHFKDY